MGKIAAPGARLVRTSRTILPTLSTFASDRVGKSPGCVNQVSPVVPGDLPTLRAGGEQQQQQIQRINNESTRAAAVRKQKQPEQQEQHEQRINKGAMDREGPDNTGDLQVERRRCRVGKIDAPTARPVQTSRYDFAHAVHASVGPHGQIARNASPGFAGRAGRFAHPTSKRQTTTEANTTNQQGGGTDARPDNTRDLQVERFVRVARRKQAPGQEQGSANTTNQQVHARIGPRGQIARNASPGFIGRAGQFAHPTSKRQTTTAANTTNQQGINKCRVGRTRRGATAHPGRASGERGEAPGSSPQIRKASWPAEAASPCPHPPH